MLIRLLTLFLFLTWAPRALAQANVCTDLFTTYQEVQGLDHTEPLEHFFSYRDHTYNFVFEAALRDNTLIMAARLIDENLKIRSARRGSELYRQMIEHFGLRNIHEIVGLWQGGKNLDDFYKNLESGMSIENAALNTWSGRQAQKYGFSKVLSYEFFDTLSLKDRQGVEVVFTRPNYKSTDLYQ